MNNSDLVLVAPNKDLLIQNGDFVFGESTNQEIANIINFTPGDLKQFLNVGVNINLYIDGNIANLQNNIKKQLIADGININILKVSLDPLGNLSINASGTRG